MSNIDVEKMQGWIHDILIWGGLIDEAKSKRNYRYENTFYSNDPVGKDAATVICNFIRTCIKQSPVRVTQINDISKALKTLTKIKFQNLTGEKEYDNLSEKELSEFIAEWLKEKKFFVSVTGNGPEEKIYIATGTPLGRSLWEAERFLIQSDHTHDSLVQEIEQILAGTNQGKTQPVQNDPNATIKQNVGPHANLVNASGKYHNIKPTFGPVSQIITNLVGQPHDKKYLSEVYIVTAIDLSDLKYSSMIDPKKTRFNAVAFITPMHDWRGKHQGTPKQISLPNPHSEKYVKIGEGQGEQNTVLFFPDVQTAEHFAKECEDNGRGEKIWRAVGKLNVVQVAVDPNGYFEVETEFGNAFIRAANLNEELLKEYYRDEN